MSKPALGRGLSALLGGAKPPPAAAPAPAPGPAAPPVDGVRRVPLADVVPSPLQPRKAFAPEALRELADSIREQGILSPLVVRARDGKFELIAGERRWRASQLAGLAEVPVLVRTADDATALELMLVENLQREGLNALEEAQGYAELMARFGLTQEQAAQKVGRSRAGVANALRLLRLPAEAQQLVREGRLSPGHAKVILGLPDAAAQLAAAREVLAGGLNVRQTEALVAAAQAPPAPAAPAKAAPARDMHVAAMEARLRERLGTKVVLHYRQGRGQIDIRFFSDDELERVLGLLGVAPE
jgi:ParB family chromosome partitioning protein